MDKEKTGALIAAARKEKNMTQKDLAERLHVSDRAVSKWERGAGFPDVGLLEPLAEALDLNVLDLLRGERTEEIDVHAAVKEALDTFQEKRRQTRRYVLGEVLKVLAFLLVCGSILSLLFPLKTGVDQTVIAGVYREGVLVGYTNVELDGVLEHTLMTGKKHYFGRFAIDCVEWTCREQANAEVSFEEYGGLTYIRAGMPSMRLYDPCTVIEPNLREFAFALESPLIGHEGEPWAEEWWILATSPELYEAYRTERGDAAPELAAPCLEPMPEFPSDWKQ